MVVPVTGAIWTVLAFAIFFTIAAVAVVRKGRRRKLMFGFGPWKPAAGRSLEAVTAEDAMAASILKVAAALCWCLAVLLFIGREVMSWM